jgi:hypothetical protein
MRELPIAARTICTEENFQLRLQYAILVEETPDGLECYGVRITEESTSDEGSVFNLTMSNRKICDLIETLANNTVTPIGLMDVVADWL